MSLLVAPPILVAGYAGGDRGERSGAPTFSLGWATRGSATMLLLLHRARSSIRATEMDSGGRDVVDWLHELGYSWVSWIFEKFTYVDLVEAVMAGVGLRPWRT